MTQVYLSLNDLCISSVVRAIITYQIFLKGDITRCSTLNLVAELTRCVTLPFRVAFPVKLNDSENTSLFNVVNFEAFDTLLDLSIEKLLIPFIALCYYS